ncbi:uncharacterized protein LOC127123188 [Lathyrus oleraceus]|uniref:uncharacterized protein LOC127123188 n=1 Tax=Pisum sativum TaxID=3888 RepID=UPI0021D306BA|nr:uncharacterized protein LOC127123188 [Pisum sativum]
MGQIAQQITGSRAQGSLPSETVQNPRSHENVNVVTTRSQKGFKDEEERATKGDHVMERVTKKDPRETNLEKFITVFKKIDNNMPFFEALEQMPMYKIFMKEVITEKRPIEDGLVAFNEKRSEISPGRRIPSKQKDPGEVTIPCTIKDISFKKVLIDSRASVSLIPLSIYQRLGLGNVCDTRTNMKFAYHSIKNAYGIAEDILVTIEKFSFPVGFVIIDIPEDEVTPIILGQPFMRTSRCNFDIDHNTLTLKVYDDDEITLNVLEIRKLEVEKENHYEVGMIRTDVKGQSDMPTSEKRLKRAISTAFTSMSNPE